MSGNYQRRRAHTLPCPTRPVGPAPPPPPPAVATGALSADLCTGTEAQFWTLGTDGAVTTTDGKGGKLCLDYDHALPAFGGEGPAVVARACGSAPTKWSWAAAGNASAVARPVGTDAVQNPWRAAQP